MQYSLQKGERGAPSQLSLSGSLTIQHASALQQLFLQQLAAGSGLHLQLQKVEELDLAGVQLLLALQKALHAQQLPYRLQLELTPLTRSLLEAAGLSSLLNQSY